MSSVKYWLPICCFAGLFGWFLNSDWTIQIIKKNAASHTEQETRTEPSPITAISSSVAKQPLEPRVPTNNAKNSAPTQAGVDPFKEFLEKQKQNSKDQIVSPFGKNQN